MLRTIMLLTHVFFFNDTATTEIYTLSLHDALPISAQPDPPGDLQHRGGAQHRARAHALHLAPDRRDRRRDPPARRRGFLAADRGARPRGPALPRQAARLAAAQAG